MWISVGVLFVEGVRQDNIMTWKGGRCVRGWEDAMQEDLSPVVPSGVELWVELKSFCGQLERGLVVHILLILKKGMSDLVEERALKEGKRTLSNRSSTIARYSMILPCSFSLVAWRDLAEMF